MSTIREVAKAAKVSETTVSLSFRAGSRISENTRQRVLRAAEKLGYVPDQAARSLRLGGAKTIGMILPDITNPFYSRMAREVDNTAQRLGYQLLLAESRGEAERELSQLARMLEARVRGVLACFCERTRASYSLLKERALPHLALDTKPKGYTGAYVINDLSAAGNLAAQHLAEQGFKRPCLLIPGGSKPELSAFADLLEGFGAGCRAAGLHFGEKQIIDCALSITAGKAALAEALRLLPKADSILCGNDLSALGAMESADAAGFKVGKNFGIIGVDNLDVSALERLGLTSVRQPDAELAAEAASALIASIDSEKPVSIHSRHKPVLIARGSTVKK